MPPMASVDLTHEAQASITRQDDLHANENLDTVPPMAQPLQAGNSRLECLPNELLMAIFDELAEEDLDSFFQTKDTSYSGCYDLCLVSKRILLVARPYLYKDISIYDHRALARLCRTISGDMKLGEEIKVMRIDVYHYQLDTLDNPPIPSEEADFLKDCYQVVGRSEGENKRSGHAYKEGELVAVLCYELIAWAVNLAALALVVGTDGAIVCEHYDENNSQSHSAFFDRFRGAIRAAAAGAGSLFLPRLQCLALQSLQGRIDREVFKHFLSLPSLKRVVSNRRDGSYWSCLTPLGGQSQTGNIELLDPYTDHCEGVCEDMAHLFPALKELSVKVQLPRPFWYNDKGLACHRALSMGLRQMTNLQTLTIGIFPHLQLPASSYDDTTDSGMVLNLAHLPNLRHLQVPLFSLTHMGRSDLDGMTVAPRKLLPHALETLRLVTYRKCVEPNGIAGWDAMSPALDFLEHLGRDLPTFQQLKTVQYYFRDTDSDSPIHLAVLPSSDEWELEGSDLSDGLEDTGASAASDGSQESAVGTSCERFFAVHDLFSKQNVEFRLERMIKGLPLQQADWKALSNEPS